MSPSTPSMDVLHHPDCTVVRFTGCDSLNEYNVECVGRELRRLVEEPAGLRLVVDLSGIHYVTSTVLGTFIALNRKVRSAGGQFALANLGPHVEETLSVTRLDTLFEICPPEEQRPDAGLPRA